MRVAIAGGNGFIGRRVTTRLTERGHEVIWLSRHTGRGSGPETPPAEEYEFDPASESSSGQRWREAIPTADAIVNLSGTPISSRWNPEVKRQLRESRVGTGRALVEAIGEMASDVRPSVFVSASGIGIYGDRGGSSLDEGAHAGDDWLSRLAVDWEAEALKARDQGVRTVIVRTGLVLGDEGFLPRIALPMRLFAGGPVGTGRQYVPWIHHDDVARVYVHAIENEAVEGPVNAVAPQQLTMREFSATLGRVLHRPSWFPVPAFMLGIVLGEVAPYTLFSQRAVPTALLDSGFEFSHPSLEEALRDLLAR